MMRNILIKSIFFGSLAISLNADFIRDSEKLVVTDTKTGLMWQDDIGVNRNMDWVSAIIGCEYLTLSGYSDWRLPNINELKSLFDNTKVNLALSPAFINFNNDYYWSSTINATDSSKVSVVVFTDGNVTLHGKKASNYARCVRTKL